MKIKRLLLISVLTIGLTVLCGCQADTEEVTDTEDSAVTETEQETGGETKTPTSEAPFTLEEMNQIYEEATAVWNYFDLEPLSAAEEYNSDGSIKFYTVDGIDGYQKVDDDTIGTWASLKAAAETYFSQEIAATLLSDGRYTEEDGILYEMAADRGTDISVGEIVKREITEYNNSSITYVITAETIDPETETVTGNKEYTFIYATTGDHWVFTEFEPIY